MINQKLEQAKDLLESLAARKIGGTHYIMNSEDVNLAYEVFNDYVERNEVKGVKELTRLVESHELVGDYYGLTRAKEHAESNYTAPELKNALKQAIADVESCMEVPSESN